MTVATLANIGGSYGATVLAARKRAGIVLTEASGTGFMCRSGQMGVIRGDGGRFRLDRVGRSGRMTARGPVNGKSYLIIERASHHPRLRKKER